MPIKKIFNGGVQVMMISCLCLLVLVVDAFAGEEYHRRYAQDLQSIQVARGGMQSTLDFIDAHPEIFTLSQDDGRDQLLDRKQRMVVWQTWQAFLDHILFLDSLGRKYTDIYLHSKDEDTKHAAFIPAFACFLAQYRFALQYIDRMEKNPAMHVVLNDAVPELGVQAGAYALLKFRFLNVIRGAEFARLNVLYVYYKQKAENPHQKAIEEDIKTIWAAGKGKGPVLTAKNAMKIVGDLGLTTWFPVQKGTAELMGNIKVWRPNISLITPVQIQELQSKLRPGDILLQRREWYASNIGIPGFWTHAALYIGSPDERAAFFQDRESANWLIDQGSKDGTLDNLLDARYPQTYPLSIIEQEDNHVPRVLEAIGEGVSFTTLEHSASADSLVALRPILAKTDKAQAILNAFQYSGRPYDFNFDFRTDSELVCSELIFKAYQKTSHSAGLSLPLHDILGRPLISPNEIARLFDREYGTLKQQLTFVTFLDGNEKEKTAVESTVETFRKSWNRPKWHIWLQGTVLGDLPAATQYP